MATKKLSKEELETINSLQNDNGILRQEFGKLAIDKINVEQREANLRNILNTLANKENELKKELADKYGNGSIDLSKGEITVEEKKEEVKTQKIDAKDESN